MNQAQELKEQGFTTQEAVSILQEEQAQQMFSEQHCEDC